MAGNRRPGPPVLFMVWEPLCQRNNPEIHCSKKASQFTCPDLAWFSMSLSGR
jgi:hypothetical protein